MKRYITLFILLAFVVSCCCVSAFASTKNVSVFLQASTAGVTYGSTVVLEGETGVVYGNESITLGNNQANFLNIYTLGYEDGTILLWSGNSYDIVLENASFSLSVPYDGNNYNYSFGDYPQRCRVQLYVTYSDGTSEMLQDFTFLHRLTDGDNRITDVLYDVSSNSHSVFLNINSQKDIRRVAIYEYMGLASSLSSAGIPVGTYSVTGISGFASPLKVTIHQEEVYNQTLENINQNQQETNDKLDDVISGQESIQDRIDELMNGNVGVTKPSGSGIIQDVMQSEQDLLDDNASNIHAGQALQQNALQVLVNYQNAFIVFALLFNMLYQIPFFQSLVIISLAIGIVSLLLNLGLHSSTRYPAKEAETKEKYGDAISADMATWRR